MCTKVYALVLMLFAAVSVYGQDNVIDEVVWVVGDEAILKSVMSSATTWLYSRTRT